MLIKLLTIFCSLLAALFCRAGDLSRDVRSGVKDTHSDSANYFELGAGVGVYNSPIFGLPEGNTRGQVNADPTLDINLYYQYHGWFVEGFSQSLEGFTLGYHLLDADKISLDLVGMQQHEELSESESHDFKGLKKRDGDFMSGIRATAYLGDYILQAHLLTDISQTHKGQVYSLKMARDWQYRNWNFHAIYGVSYRSDAVMNYYFSVQPEDANQKFPAFRAQAGLLQMTEVGVTYPLSEKWVYRGLLRYVALDRQWTGSPLVVSNNGKVFLNSISYVF